MGYELLVYGIVGTLIACILIFVFFFLLFVMHNTKNNIDMKITVVSAGKPYVYIVKARKTNKKGIGLCYEIADKSFRNQQMHIVPFFGESYTYSVMGKKRQYLPLTYNNGAYAPEEYVAKELVNVVVDIDNKGTTVQKEIERHIVKPIKTSLRQTYINIMKYHEVEYGEKQGWWQKNGALVLSFSILFVVMVVSIMMIIFANQYAQAIASGEEPAWMNTFISRLSNIINGEPPA